MQQNPNAVLVFQDEVHFTINTLITRKWWGKGSKPKVKSYPGRHNASYSGYVISETGELYVNKPSVFNYETVINSLRDFVSCNPIADGKKYYIVMDNAPWHKKAKRLIIENVNGEYNDLHDRIVFVYLPPYSPDLNPIEQVWRITRREVTHNTFFSCIERLSNALDAFFTLFNHPNSRLQRLCSFNSAAA